MHTLDIAPLRGESPPQKRSGMARVLKGFQFYLDIHTFIRNRNEPYLPLPSQPQLVLLLYYFHFFLFNGTVAPEVTPLIRVSPKDPSYAIFTGQVPFPSPSQQCQSAEEKSTDVRIVFSRYIGNW